MMREIVIRKRRWRLVRFARQFRALGPANFALRHRLCVAWVLSE